MIPAGFPRIHFDRKFFRDISAIEAAIALLGINLNDFKEPLKVSLELVIMPSIAKNFQAGGRPRWKPLSESWMLRRIPGPVLIQSGAMFEATQSITNWDVDHNSITMTGVDSAPYAGFHQAGTRRMPARPFVMYQQEDIENIVQIFEIWVDGLVDRYWTKF